MNTRALLQLLMRRQDLMIDMTLRDRAAGLLDPFSQREYYEMAHLACELIREIDNPPKRRNRK